MRASTSRKPAVRPLRADYNCRFARSPPAPSPMRSAAAKPKADARTEREMANAIRALAMDAVQAANSGHPGMPMGMAEIAVALWQRHLRHNPTNPKWADRDRFVLSNGHGSMLLYALLHLTGYDLPLAELKRFRQLGSMTPGHPERGVAPGVETTTGPLGQGLANAVGMALAERLLAKEFNRPGLEIVDHHTYAFVGDGCLMEGISHEACSLAGTLGLGKLIVLYDDNGISIDGHVRNWFTDDTPKRFEAYGWHVVADVDGHDVEAVDAAIQAAQLEHRRPSLVCCKTLIAKGAPNKGEHPRRARRAARQGGDRGDARRDRLAASAVRGAARRLRGVGRARDRRRGGVGVERAVRALPAQVPGPRRAVPAPHGGRAAVGLGRARARARREDQRQGRDGRHPQEPRRTRSKASRRCCPSSSAARPTSPDRTSRCGRGRAWSTPARAATTSRSGCASSGCRRSRTGWRCTAASSPTWAPSSRSRTTRATRCAWRR